MPVKVDLVASGRFVAVDITGHVTRRELGWATERVRELARVGTINGVLIDAGEMLADLTPAFAGEAFENFLLALDEPVPVAGVRPAGWSEGHKQTVRARVSDLAATTLSFDTRDAALDWLEQAVPDRLEDS